MNVKPFKKLRLEALDRLNQNQRIELIKHEFKELLDLENDDVDNVNDKIDDLLEIESYLGRKGYYSDVMYARYVTLSDKYLELEITNSILRTNTKNIIIGKMVYDLWERYFYLTYLLDTCYNHWICYTSLPMKHQDNDLIFDDGFSIRNDNLVDDIGTIIELLYEQIVKGMDQLSDDDSELNIKALEDTINGNDKEVNETIREYYQEVIDGMDKLKEDGFILAKEDELELRKEIGKECNQRNHYKPNDIGFIDVDNLEIRNHISYDLEKCEIIYNEIDIDFERKEDRMYLLLKPLGIDDK